MLSSYKSLLAGAIVGASTLGFSGMGMAGAFPSNFYSNNNTGFIQIAERNRGNMEWNRDRDGDRCRERRGDCRHFHRGYYYKTPWWTLPLIIGDAYANDRYYDDDGFDGMSSRHVEWCMDRYRSYNPRTNTWVSYSGIVHQCNSPYA
jgi:hypothetical protein